MLDGEFGIRNGNFRPVGPAPETDRPGKPPKAVRNARRSWRRRGGRRRGGRDWRMKRPVLSSDPVPLTGAEGTGAASIRVPRRNAAPQLPTRNEHRRSARDVPGPLIERPGHRATDATREVSPRRFRGLIRVFSAGGCRVTETRKRERRMGKPWTFKLVRQMTFRPTRMPHPSGSIPPPLRPLNLDRPAWRDT